MPTISQLPNTAAITAADQIPLSQDGVARSTSVAALLAEVQPAILIEQGALLGRSSLGVGGPEPVLLGEGLALNDGTLSTTAGLLNTFGAVTTVTAGDSLVIRRNGALALIDATSIRDLYHAGSHVTIDPDGTIAAVWPTAAEIGATGSVDVQALPRTLAPQSGDLITINRAGVLLAATYETLLDGVTIDQAAPAGPASDADSLWVAQGGNVMSRQSLANIWSWLATKVPEVRAPIVEIEANTTLDGSVHHGRILVCTQAVQLTPSIQNMGAGFRCEVINLASSPVTFGAGFVSALNGTMVLPGRGATVLVLGLASGLVAYANVHGAVDPANLPGAVQSLAVTAVTTSSVSLVWTAPTTGVGPFTYGIQYRAFGATVWQSGPSSLATTSGTVSGLSSGSVYELIVIAQNTYGGGNPSIIVEATTQSSGTAPGQPVNLAAVTQSSDSVALTWNAPTSGGSVTNYVVQYRTTGSSVWSGGIGNVAQTNTVVSGLAPETGYDFRVLAENATGVGPASTIVSAMTQAITGMVTSIQWNMAPAGPYTAGSGAIGVNVLVTPAEGAVRFGFSTSSSIVPTTWTLGVHVMTNLWGAYVDTPATPGTWYAWAQGTDGSASTPHMTPFTVQ
jgi:hypothetical protein